MANLPPLMPDWWKAPDTIEIGTEAIIDWFDMPVGLSLIHISEPTRPY